MTSNFWVAAALTWSKLNKITQECVMLWMWKNEKLWRTVSAQGDGAYISGSEFDSGMQACWRVFPFFGMDCVQQWLSASVLLLLLLLLVWLNHGSPPDLACPLEVRWLGVSVRWCLGVSLSRCLVVSVKGSGVSVSRLRIRMETWIASVPRCLG